MKDKENSLSQEMTSANNHECKLQEEWSKLSAIRQVKESKIAESTQQLQFFKTNTKEIASSKLKYDFHENNAYRITVICISSRKRGGV